MINADEARELSLQEVETSLEWLNKLIAMAAITGKWRVPLGDKILSQAQFTLLRNKGYDLRDNHCMPTAYATRVVYVSWAK